MTLGLKENMRTKLMKTKLKKSFLTAMLFVSVASSSFISQSAHAYTSWMPWGGMGSSMLNPWNMGSFGGMNPWSMGSLGGMNPWSMGPWNNSSALGGTGWPMLNAWNGLGNGINPYQFFSGNAWNRGDWGRRNRSDDYLLSLMLLNSLQNQNPNALLYPPSLGYDSLLLPNPNLATPLWQVPLPNTLGGMNPNAQGLANIPNTSILPPTSIPSVRPSVPESQDGFPPTEALHHYLNNPQSMQPLAPAFPSSSDKAWVFPDGSSVPFSEFIR